MGGQIEIGEEMKGLKNNTQERSPACCFDTAFLEKRLKDAGSCNLLLAVP